MEERVDEKVRLYISILRKLDKEKLPRIKFDLQRATEIVFEELGRDKRTPQIRATQRQIKEMKRLGIYYPFDISKHGASELIGKKRDGVI